MKNKTVVIDDEIRNIFYANSIYTNRYNWLNVLNFLRMCYLTSPSWYSELYHKSETNMKIILEHLEYLMSSPISNADHKHADDVANLRAESILHTDGNYDIAPCQHHNEGSIQSYTIMI